MLATRKDLLQRAPHGHLTCVIKQPARFARLIQRRDARMGDGGLDALAILELLDHFLVADQVRPQKHEGHVALHRVLNGVVGFRLGLGVKAANHLVVAQHRAGREHRCRFGGDRRASGCCCRPRLFNKAQEFSFTRRHQYRHRPGQLLLIPGEIVAGGVERAHLGQLHADGVAQVEAEGSVVENHLGDQQVNGRRRLGPLHGLHRRGGFHHFVSTSSEQCGPGGPHFSISIN